MKTSLSIISLVLIILVFSDQEVFACSCITLPLNERIEASKNIVILELKSIEKYKENEESYDEDKIKQSKLIVKKVFKGNLKVGEELNFTQGICCICVWGFREIDIGKEFIFFLYENSYENGLWEGYVCSGSGSVESVKQDLLYLEKMNSIKAKTRIYGRIAQRFYKEDKTPFYKPIAGIKIRISGNGTNINIKTNKDGIYEIYNLPFGKYRLILPKIEGYEVTKEGNFVDNPIIIDFKETKFLEVDFNYIDW